MQYVGWGAGGGVGVCEFLFIFKEKEMANSYASNFVTNLLNNMDCGLE